MVLWPAVKDFIEAFIKDIEVENMREVFRQSMIWLNQVEFNQLYSILDDLPLQYDLDDAIDNVIRDVCGDIIKEHTGEYICIEDEWLEYSNHWFHDPEKILARFDQFECSVKNKRHWCEVYEY